MSRVGPLCKAVAHGGATRCSRAASTSEGFCYQHAEPHRRWVNLDRLSDDELIALAYSVAAHNRPAALGEEPSP